MAWVTTKRKIGSSGYASVVVKDRSRAGSGAAPSGSSSNPVNVEKENILLAEEIKKIQASVGTSSPPPPTSSVIVGVKTKEGGGYSSERLDKGLSETQKKELTAIAVKVAQRRNATTSNASVSTPTRAARSDTVETLPVTKTENAQPEKETMEWVEKFFSSNPAKNEITYIETGGNEFTFTRDTKVYGTLTAASKETSDIMHRERAKEKLLGTDNYTFFLSQQKAYTESVDYYSGEISKVAVKLGWVTPTNTPTEQIGNLANSILNTDSPKKWTTGKIVYNVGAVPYDVGKTLLVDYPVYAPLYSGGKMVVETVTSGGGNILDLGYSIYSSVKSPTPQTIRLLGDVAGVIAAPSIVYKIAGKTTTTVKDPKGLQYDNLPSAKSQAVYRYNYLVKRGSVIAKEVKTAAKSAKISESPLDFYAYKGRRPTKATLRARSTGKTQFGNPTSSKVKEFTITQKGQPPINVKETTQQLAKKGGKKVITVSTQVFNSQIETFKKGKTKVKNVKVTKTESSGRVEIKTPSKDVIYVDPKGGAKFGKAKTVITNKGELISSPTTGTARTRAVSFGSQKGVVVYTGTRPQGLATSPKTGKIIQVLSKGAQTGSRTILLRTQNAILRITKSKKAGRPVAVEYFPRKKTTKSVKIGKGFEQQLKKAGVSKTQYLKAVKEQRTTEQATVLQYQKGGYRSGMREKLKAKIETTRQKFQTSRTRNTGQSYSQLPTTKKSFTDAMSESPLKGKKKVRLINYAEEQTNRGMIPVAGQENIQTPRQIGQLTQGLAIGSVLDFGKIQVQEKQAKLVLESKLSYSLAHKSATIQETESKVAQESILETKQVQESIQQQKVKDDEGQGQKGGGRGSGGRRPVVPDPIITKIDPVIVPTPKTERAREIRKIIQPERIKPRYTIDSKKSESKKSISGFNVFVRRKGKFRQVNVGALSKEQALDFGASTVRNTAAATFKIMPTTEKVRSKFRGQPARLFSFINKPNGLYIQRSRERISSIGEKREITYKGIFSSKKRSNKKSIFGGGKKWAF